MNMAPAIAIDANTAAQDELLEQYLTFTTDDKEYGIAIRYVKDIIQIPEQPITPVPWLSDYIRGIINLRGSIVPVIDVRVRFGNEVQSYQERTCIIKIELEEMSIGMLVDSVKEVLTISSKDLARPPQRGGASENRYVSSIASLNDGQEIVLLVDIFKLFYDGEVLPDAVNVM